MEALGGGLAVFAFWGFIASCVIGGIWYAIREKQAQHETLRRIIESGKDVDAEVIDRIMSGDKGKSEVDLQVGGYITLAVAPGLVVLGWFLQMATGNDKVFMVMVGVAGLVICVAGGILFASKIVKGSRKTPDDKSLL